MHPSIMNTTRSSPDRSAPSSSARAVSVIATKGWETVDVLVAQDFPATCSSSGVSLTGL